MRRGFALFATLVLLWGLVSIVNDALAPRRIYLFAGGLFVAYSALTQPRRTGLIVSMLGGLLCDANVPVVFGTHMLLFAAAHLTLLNVRDRVPRHDNVAAIVVVLLTNLALFLVFSFGQIHDSPAPAAVWPRLIADLLCSQVFLALITPWFFALQGATMLLTGSRDEVV